MAKPAITRLSVSGRTQDAQVGSQNVWTESGWRVCPIYERSLLSAGASFDGPAIVPEFDSTTVVLPGYTAEMDRYFNILINPKA